MSSPNSLPVPSSDCTVATEKSQVRPPKLLAKGFLFARLHPRQPSAVPGTSQISGAAQNSSQTNSQIPVPPLFPADRNATSTRILLQDTKATMEACATRLGQLVTGVEQTMVEAKLIGKTLETSHDNVVAETVDVGGWSHSF
ncbi:hypothetical protein BD410DRAFT_153220 [Rickenella mellea]|uniref:Uncharacterized protein n=1 Tax=Rickenella mellea TaxID=50990 RepID=A0A4Y7Q870_9AGAM|nr:hypothetical protein BD410DRAFT_153220 [Rickenella mellea]